MWWSLAALPPIVVGIALAAETGIPPWIVAAAAGVGTVITAALSGKVVVPTFSWTRERDSADRYERKNDEQNRWIAEEVVPALSKSAEAVQRTTDLVVPVMAEAREMNARMLAHMDRSDDLMREVLAELRRRA